MGRESQLCDPIPTCHAQGGTADSDKEENRIASNSLFLKRLKRLIRKGTFIMTKMYFTSESVTSGHPDKVCDYIADSILDEALRQDPDSHMAVEATIKDDLVLIYGEAGTRAELDYGKIALQAIREIGYTEE